MMNGDRKVRRWGDRKRLDFIHPISPNALREQSYANILPGFLITGTAF
jgi:hypothetical protein